MHPLQKIIEKAFDDRDQINPSNVAEGIKNAVYEAMELLDNGTIRVAEKINGEWQTHQWIKKAILLLFKIRANEIVSAGFTQFFDKVPLKFSQYNLQDFHDDKVRIVPPATVRKGAYLAPNTVLMPCYVNVGAYVDSNSLIDTWATVGSCAQIGKNVHISGGVGIGGILEPLQANPTIIEDNCFIGARSEIVEGVIVEQGSVISMGVFIGQSTPIYDRQQKTIQYGRVPAGSVVVPGTLPSKDGSYGRYSAIIVKQVDEKTRNKVSLNELLREETQ